MSLKNKIKIYRTCVKLMIYIIEIRTETSIIKCLIRTIEIKILRYVTDNILQDRIRNEYIHSICKIQDAIKWVRIRKRA